MSEGFKRNNTLHILCIEGQLLRKEIECSVGIRLFDIFQYKINWLYSCIPGSDNTIKKRETIEKHS